MRNFENNKDATFLRFCMTMVFRLGMSGLICLFLPSCGRGAPPPPPTARSDLTIELFRALQARDHQTSLKKIERLRTINPGNVFLANLEIRERINVEIQKSCDKVNSGNPEEALRIIDGAIVKFGKESHLLEARDKAETALKLKESLAKVADPEHSVELARNAGLLRQIAGNFPKLTPLKDYAEEKFEEARLMREWEDALTILGACSDLQEMFEDGNPHVNLAYSLIELEDPDCRILPEYRKYIEGNKEKPEPFR